MSVLASIILMLIFIGITAYIRARGVVIIIAGLVGILAVSYTHLTLPTICSV